MSPVTLVVLFGTYAQGDAQGLYAAAFDPKTGRLTAPQQVAQIANPGFFALDEKNLRLYAVGRGNGDPAIRDGRIAALALDPANGRWDLINELPTQGQGPCHVDLHPDGQYAAVANYGSGSAEVFAIGDDGSLVGQTGFVQHEGSSVDPQRQEGPHAHCVKFDPAGRFLFVADLGLDRVLVYRFDPENGTLTALPDAAGKTPPGAGPRHLAFHPQQPYLYVVNEMGGSVTGFHFDADSGRLTPIETVDALPPDYQDARRAAEILVHPAGRMLYCSHRGHDSVAALAIDSATGKLTLAGTGSTKGSWPRNFGIDPTGRWIIAANKNSDNAAVMEISPEDGVARPTGLEVEVPQAVCVRFLAMPAP